MVASHRESGRQKPGEERLYHAQLCVWAEKEALRLAFSRLPVTSSPGTCDFKLSGFRVPRDQLGTEARGCMDKATVAAASTSRTARMNDHR